MKKLFITLAFVMSIFLCQAQFYVGGDLGVGFQNGKNKVGSLSQDLPKTTTFEIAPNVGYMFSDMLGAGIELGYYLESTKNSESKSNSTINSNIWTVAPYFRCVFAKFDYVNLYADLKLAFAGFREKNKHESITVESPKIFDMNIGVIPGIAYNLNEHISINANLNLLSWSYEYETINEGKDNKEQVNIFGIGINSPTLLTVGFFYNF